MRRYLPWACSVLLFCVLASSFVWYTQQNIIVRLPSGFYPQTTYIDQNESVRFINLVSQPSWPASGPHPTHTSYPAFDPQQGITFGKSWSFTFTAEGSFSFHDHFAPEYTGIIVVGKNDLSLNDELNTCKELSDPQQEEGCVEIYFRNVIKSAPYAQARAIYEDIAVQYPNSCHGFAHDLGRNLFMAYQEGELPTIGEEASSCSYGLWHGFTTAMQNDRGFGATKEFCGSLTGETEELQYINRMNCYHGIGIGLIPDPPQEHLWGDFHAITEPAVTYCDTITEDPLYTERCLTGVYHAMTDFMVNKNAGFIYDETSLGACALEKEEHQYECFITLSSAVHTIAGNDLSRTIAILKDHSPSQELFLEMFVNSAIMMVDAKADLMDHADFVHQCEQEDASIRQKCVSAVLIGLYANGTPGIEYQDAFAFCSGDWIYEHEKGACMFDVVKHARKMYTPEKIALICADIPENHRRAISDCGI